MNSGSPPRTLHRPVAVAVALALMGVFGVAPALANDPDPEAQDASCGKALVDFGKAARAVLTGDAKDEASGLAGLHASMRSSCEPFRTCKRECREDKRAAAEACKGLSGAEKKKCKKEARQEKKACKQGCRDEMEAAGCKTARRTFWGSMGKVAGAVAKDKDVRAKGKEAIAICKSLYKE